MSIITENGIFSLILDGKMTTALTMKQKTVIIAVIYLLFLLYVLTEMLQWVICFSFAFCFDVSFNMEEKWDKRTIKRRRKERS